MAAKEAGKAPRITARIPSDHLSAFITEVEANGNVTNKQESVEDVTLSYADVESRKKTLLVEQGALMGAAREGRYDGSDYHTGVQAF